MVGDSTTSAVVVYIDKDKKPGILRNIKLSFPKISTIRNVLFFGQGNAKKNWIKAVRKQYVAYFKQHIGAVHSKGWLKLAFSIFCATRESGLN